MKFPYLIAFSHVDLAVNIADAYKYFMTTSTLGKSYVLLHSKLYRPVPPFWLLMIGGIGVKRGNIHTPVLIYRHPSRNILSSLFFTITWSWEKVTVHPELYNGPILTSKFLKFGII